MKYEKGTQKNRYETHSFIERTNCTDKVRGHSFGLASKEIATEVRKQFPQMASNIWICSNCNKVVEST